HCCNCNQEEYEVFHKASSIRPALTPNSNRVWQDCPGRELMVDATRLHSSFPGKIAIAGIFHPQLSRIECRPMIVFHCHFASNSSNSVHVFFVQVAMN